MEITMRMRGILFLLLTLTASCRAANIKVGAMYGENTHVDDVYKNILTDAQQYINRDNTILPPSDEVSVVHYQATDGQTWFRESISVAIRESCSFINNKDANALILPDDVCSSCQGLGYIMGNAYTPTIATDQAAGSEAIKMYPVIDDMIELVSGVIKNYRWTTFIVLYDQDTGNSMLEALMNMALETKWEVTPMALEDDVAAQMKELKKNVVKNIVVYMHIEENTNNVVQMVKIGVASGAWVESWL